ncbi:MAG TPA: kynureninase [Candidatus Limnocylindrales bacterium]|nr:kynureninase [Candidatus Limnocylindrales bacterium]
MAASAEPVPALSPLDRAAALDASDPLRAFRDQFVIADPGLVYVDGNSLGRLPKATVERLSRVVEAEWGGELIRAWDHWLDEPARVGDLIAPLIGAAPSQVIVSDSTTVNFYKLAVAALDARPGRRAVITDRDNFPTDRYVLEGLARARDLVIDWLEPDPIDGPTTDAVAAALARHDGDVALVTLTHVNYRSAAIADMAAITQLAHDAGALVLWDLSHSAGAVNVALDEADVDLAVGCTYKFLCGGPGAPAYLYVAGALQDELRNPIQGWFGQRDQFAMAQGYDPAPGIVQWLAGTPGIIALAAVEEGVRLVAEAGIDRIRAKGIALTTFAIELVDTELAPLGFSVGSPRDPAARGAHVAIRHPDAKRLTAALIDGGVVPDFREPDSIRFGMSPLTTTFTEIARGVEQLARLAG